MSLYICWNCHGRWVGTNRIDSFLAKVVKKIYSRSPLNRLKNTLLTQRSRLSKLSTPLTWYLRIPRPRDCLRAEHHRLALAVKATRPDNEDDEGEPPIPISRSHGDTLHVEG